MKVSHNSSRRQGFASHNDRMFDTSKAEHILKIIVIGAFTKEWALRRRKRRSTRSITGR